MTTKRPTDPNSTAVLVMIGVAAAIGGCVYAGLYVGSMIAVPDQVMPANPFDMITGLRDGTLAWPGAAVWWISGLALSAIVAVAVWITIARGSRQHGLASARQVTGSRRSKDAHRQVIGFERRKPVSIRAEDSGLMIAPPRSGKTTTRVISAVIDAPGAVVTTSTKAEVLRQTHLLRSRRGRIHVFDPEGMSGWATPATWDIVSGCEEPTEAVERARAMIKAVPMGEGASNAAFFEQAAAQVLGTYLHAAALEGRTISDVVRWAHDTSAKEPSRILESHPAAAPGWAKELATYTQGSAGPTIQSVQMTLGNALAALRTGQTVQAVLPSAHPFDVDAFLESADTLYLMSTMGDGSAAPLTTALVATIERHARLRSQASVEGRFDIPVTLVLDEAPNIAPIPSLPALMTDSGGRGIIVWTITQSFAQLVGRWGEQGATTMLNGAAATVLLGGVKEADLLEQLSRLAGQRRVTRTTSSSGRQGSSQSYASEWEDILRVDQIRQLPVGKGLLFYLNKPPVIIDMQPWWKRSDADMIKQSMQNGLHAHG